MFSVRLIFLSSFLLLLIPLVNAQENVGIGLLNPDPSAILHLESSDKGFLMTRVTTAERLAIGSPAAGLLVYDTNDESFWYFDGAQWVQVSSGAQGPQGPAGNDGISVTNAIINFNDDLIITLSNGNTINAGTAVGSQGPSGQNGNDGADGISVVNATVNSNDDLIITLSNGNTVNAGNVVGPQGSQGVAGSPGQNGNDGISVTNATINSNDDLIITLSNGNTVNAGNAVGPQGQQGPQGATGPAGPLVSGTNGQTLRHNGTTWIANSNLYNNGTNIGIGTTNPTYKLHVDGRIKTEGITEISDRRLKKDIKPIENASELLQALNGVFYLWKDSEKFNDQRKMGLIAQEVEKVIPEVVDTDSEGYKSVQYSVLVALLIEALKEQQNVINTQSNDMANVQSRLEQIEAALGMDSEIYKAEVK